MRKTCETCKHYSESDEDAFMHGVYKAVFRNSCELHEEPMHRFWEQMCEDWEPNEEEGK